MAEVDLDELDGLAERDDRGWVEVTLGEDEWNALISAARERDELRREVGELREKMDDARKLLLKGSDTTALAVLTFALRKGKP